MKMRKLTRSFDQSKCKNIETCVYIVSELEPKSIFLVRYSERPPANSFGFKIIPLYEFKQCIFDIASFVASEL